ncbi:MAG: hypothetical protein R8F63_07375 [Acidimicrobiales bacterium]|nr:hypothetical protein [Acidimicrobiales bacterium]
MSDDDPIAEQLLDLFVYAPIGLALEAKELIPKLADRGRGQVALTRLAGKVASDRGENEMRRIIEQIASVVGVVLTGDPGSTARPDEAGSRLPIDDYDDLTAPELLPYLPPLDESQLADVLAYEESHRGRATVINRIRQLQG